MTTRKVSDKAARLLKRAGIQLFPAWTQKELLWSAEEYQTIRLYHPDAQYTAPGWWSADEFAPLPPVLSEAFQMDGNDLCNAKNHFWHEVEIESLLSMLLFHTGKILLHTSQLSSVLIRKF